MKRSKSNLIVASPEPFQWKPLQPEERRTFLRTLELWRVFDLYLEGLQELA